MPLSEHEQRVLAELEESLVRHDPDFAERVRSETVYRHAGRRCKWAAAGFVAGGVIMVAFFSRSVLAGLFGFAIMFVSAVVFERNLRHMGKAGWRDFTRSLREEDPDRKGNGIETAVHGARRWLRTHLLRRDR